MRIPRHLVVFSAVLPVAITTATGALHAQTQSQTPARTATPATAPREAPLPTRFQAQIDAFVKGDSTSRPPDGSIVFIGSSIFRQWDRLAEQMAPLPVYNRAFGGSQTADVLHYMGTAVLQYRPRVVVYYCGSNDVNFGHSAPVITSRIVEFHTRLQKELPGTRMIVASVLRAPQKRSKWASVDSVNSALRDYAAKASNIKYVEINPVLVDANGAVKPQIYLADSLHYLPDAYVLFADVIKPVLQRTWNSR